MIACMKRGDGFPKRATAAMWSAMSDVIGAGTSDAETPSGTTSAVTKPMTAAPWENPPSTILVCGQLAAVATMCVRASAMPIDSGGEIRGGRVADRVHADRLRADSRAQRVDERLAGRTRARIFGGAAGEYHLGVGAGRCPRGRHWDCCKLHYPSRHHGSPDQTRNAARSHEPMLTRDHLERALIGPMKRNRPRNPSRSKAGR